jgi:hypothetical protein
MNFHTSLALTKNRLIIQVQIESDGIKLSYFEAKKKTSLVWISAENLTQIIAKSGTFTPCILLIRGSGILYRNINEIPNYKDALIVNGNKNEFYFNAYYGKSKLTVAFFRKSLIESITTELNALKVDVFGIYIGDLAILPYVDNNYSYFLEHEIRKENDEIITFEKNKGSIQPIVIHDKFIDYIDLQTSSILSIDSEQPDNFEQGIPESIGAISLANSKEKRIFKYLGIFIISFFLIALVSNYFYVNHLNQKVAESELEISNFSENLSIIDQLTQEKNRKLLLMNSSGVNSKEYISYYLDEVGASVPNGINLLDMDVFPLSANLKPKQKVETQVSIIDIKGVTLNSRILDIWIKRLENKSWTSSVEIINYFRLENLTSEFTLRINLKE